MEGVPNVTGCKVPREAPTGSQVGNTPTASHFPTKPQQEVHRPTDRSSWGARWPKPNTAAPRRRSPQSHGGPGSCPKSRRPHQPPRPSQRPAPPHPRARKSHRSLEHDLGRDRTLGRAL